MKLVSTLASARRSGGSCTTDWLPLPFATPEDD